MNSNSKKLFTIFVLSGVLFSAEMSMAQDSGDRAVDQFICKDITRRSGPSREVAIAFVHGYLLGKSGETKFNVIKLAKQTNRFIERCLDNPNEKVIDAISKVQK